MVRRDVLATGCRRGVIAFGVLAGLLSVQLAQAQAAPAEDPCVRDAARLKSLRSDPSVDAIRKFERELGCEHIRPQLQRLRESLGL